MKKKEITQLIQANEIIDKNIELLSTIRSNGHFSHYISEELWFPNIPEFKKYFEVLKKELIQAREETIKAKQIISKANCSHEVRLNYHSALYSMNSCVLCGKEIPSDNVISFKKITDRNHHTVTFDARNQYDDYDSYELKNGKTNDEVRKMILDILKNYNEEDEVDLVKEFSKLDLKNVEINTKKRKEENYILIIGGTNLEYIDSEKNIYVGKQLESSSIDFFQYFISLLNTKVAVIDRKETIEKDGIKKLETDHNRVCFYDYITLDSLKTALYQVKSIPFRLIIDLSEIYNYEIEENRMKQTIQDLKLKEIFPNSQILKITKSNGSYCYLENEQVVEKDLEETCGHAKKLLRK